MPVMLEKLYDALRAANVPDDKARAAAVELAELRHRRQVVPELATIPWAVAVSLVVGAALFAAGFLTVRYGTPCP